MSKWVLAMYTGVIIIICSGLGTVSICGMKLPGSHVQLFSAGSFGILAYFGIISVVLVGF